MSWPRDDAKLARVRALMADEGLDALVVRAPDNVLYLTNFWGMKGYDACVFPREGEPVLVCLEASAEDAARTAWTGDVRYIRGYDESDPRPVPARTLEAALSAAEGRVGLELSLGTQAADRMVGEPTTFTKAWFDAFPDAADAAPLLARARMIKTEQEVARLRIANEVATQAMHYTRRQLQPGMNEAEVAALWQGHVHSRGHARDDVELALPFSLIWSGKGIKTFTATGDLPVVEGEPVLFEIWVCTDGYWADHTKNLVVGELKPEYAELEQGLMAVYERAIEACSPGRSMAELDRSVRDGLAALGYAGQPSHPICHGIGARAHEPPYPHQAGGGDVRGEHGARDRARRVLGGRRRAAGRGQLPRHRGRRWRSSRLPGRGRALLSEIWTGTLNDAVPRRRQRRPLRHDAARRRADRRRRARPGAEARDREAARRARHRPHRGRLPARLAGRLATRSSSSPRQACARRSGASRARCPPISRRSSSWACRLRVIESPISDLKLDAIGVDREKMLGRITDAMRFAAEHGIHAAFFGVDSTRAEPDVLRARLQVGRRGGRARGRRRRHARHRIARGGRRARREDRRRGSGRTCRCTSTATTTSASRPPPPSRPCAPARRGSTGRSTAWASAPAMRTSARSR